MSLSLSGGVHIRHVEMTSSFMTYIGNLVLMFNSYLCTCYCASLVLSEAVCCVEVSLIPLSTCRRGLGISASLQQLYIPIHNALAEAVCC